MVDKRNASIVVVDDETYICNIILEALASDKYTVKAFTDSREAMKYVRENHIDLVLSDLVMKDCSGVEVLDTTLSTHRDAIFILMTAHPTVETAISVLRKGAYDFLVKPFKLDLLRATISRGLEHQRVLRDNVQLKGQVEFLQAANSAATEESLDEYLGLVIKSAKKELSATAAAVLVVDPETKSVLRQIESCDDEKYRSEVLDESSVVNFMYTKSARPAIRKDQIFDDGETLTQIFISQPIFIRRRLHAVINLFILSRFDELTDGQLSVLSILSNSAASAIANDSLYRDLQQSYLHAIRGLAKAIEARDPYTAGHTDRVSRLAELIAWELEWDKPRIDNLIMGCTLHDIGKIGVPDAILNKPGRLTDEERKKMNSHPKLGYKIIHGIDLFKPAIPYIIAHHEWFDGTGYPKGLKGEDIPIEGRLLAVADTFDAIMSDRPYRKGGSLQKAVSELLKFSGRQFDPEIVATFVRVIRKGKVNFVEMYGREEDVRQIDEAHRTTETARV